MGEANLSYADITKPKVDMSKDDEKAVAAKFEGYKHQRKAVQQKVQWSLTLFPSLFFMLFGILRWRMREANREKIKL